MGAVGSAAPWFLTGWADEVEIEFMIDTGCQVTILAASVFERNVCVRTTSEGSAASVWMPTGFGRLFTVICERGDRTDYCFSGTQL